MTTRPTAVQFRDDIVRLALEAYDRVHPLQPLSVTGHGVSLRGAADREAFALHMRERAAQAAQVYEVYAALNETSAEGE